MNEERTFSHITKITGIFTSKEEVMGVRNYSCSIERERVVDGRPLDQRVGFEHSKTAATVLHSRHRHRKADSSFKRSGFLNSLFPRDLRGMPLAYGIDTYPANQYKTKGSRIVAACGCCTTFEKPRPADNFMLVDKNVLPTIKLTF